MGSALEIHIKSDILLMKRWRNIQVVLPGIIHQITKNRLCLYLSLDRVLKQLGMESVHWGRLFLGDLGMWKRILMSELIPPGASCRLHPNQRVLVLNPERPGFLLVWMTGANVRGLGILTMNMVILKLEPTTLRVVKTSIYHKQKLRQKALCGKILP